MEAEEGQIDTTLDLIPGPIEDPTENIRPQTKAMGKTKKSKDQVQDKSNTGKIRRLSTKVSKKTKNPLSIKCSARFAGHAQETQLQSLVSEQLPSESNMSAQHLDFTPISKTNTLVSAPITTTSPLTLPQNPNLLSSSTQTSDNHHGYTTASQLHSDTLTTIQSNSNNPGRPNSPNIHPPSDHPKCSSLANTNQCNSTSELSAG